MRAQGSSLQLDGARYIYKGFNSYYLLQKASDPGTRPQVTCLFIVSAMTARAYGDGF